ncbi:MAG: hypothetical protein KC457_19060, partial [Myxococcales bacterium]|nr:hypothetical protein [Myxococcales bacterium]
LGFDDGFALDSPSAGPTLELPPDPAPPRRPVVSGPAAPFESGTWALDDDDEFDVNLDPSVVGLGMRRDSTSLPRVEPERSAIPSPRTSDDYIGVPVDDEDESFDPFSADDSGIRRRSQTGVAAVSATPEPRGGVGLSVGLGAGTAVGPGSMGKATAPTVRAMSAASSGTFERDVSSSAAPAVAAPAPVVPPMAAPVTAPAVMPGAASLSTSSAPVMKATLRDIKAAAPPGAATQREIGVMGSPDSDTRRELPSFGRGPAELNDLAAGIGEGSLVYVALGFAENVTRVLQAPSFVVDDRVDPREAWTTIKAMPVGSILIVSREDPSPLLGWILRRLEEGFRVFLETRARSPEGARRMLLGVDASPRAEAWLRGLTQLVIEPSGDGPRVRIVDDPLASTSA